MRTISVVLFLLALGSVFSPNPAEASTGITLSSSQASSVSFSPVGPMTPGNQNVSIDFFAPFSSGNAAVGLGSLLGLTGFYSVTGGPVDLTLVGRVPGIFALYSAANTTLSFSINSAPDGSGTNLLSGTIKLVDLSEIFGSGHTDDFGTANIIITGGSDQSFFPNDSGIARFNIDLDSTFLPNLSSTFETNLSNGNTLDPAPELNTLVLSGTSLLLLGGLLRRLKLR